MATYTVTVTDEDGKVLVENTRDITADDLDYSREDISRDLPATATEEEKQAHLALYFAAPNICPWDCDSCRA